MEDVKNRTDVRLAANDEDHKKVINSSNFVFVSVNKLKELLNQIVSTYTYWTYVRP